MFLVLEDQQAQSLESKVLAEVRMPDSILFVCFYYLLPIILLISRSRLNNEFHFVLNPDEKVVSVWLSLDEFYRVPHELHEIVIV